MTACGVGHVQMGQWPECFFSWEQSSPGSLSSALLSPELCTLETVKLQGFSQAQQSPLGITDHLLASPAVLSCRTVGLLGSQVITGVPDSWSHLIECGFVEIDVHGAHSIDYPRIDWTCLRDHGALEFGKSSWVNLC